MLLKKISIVLILGLTVFGFQNCSKADFSKADASSKLLGDGGVKPDLTANEMDEEIKKEEENIAEEEEDKGKEENETEESEGKVCKKMDARDRYIKTCKRLRDSHMASAGDISIKNFRGIRRQRVSNVEEIKNARGIIFLLGDKEDSAIKSVKNFRGILVACGLDIDEINNSKGIIVTVHGDIVKSNNTFGILLSYGGSLGDINHHKGLALQRGSAPKMQAMMHERAQRCEKKKIAKHHEPRKKKEYKKKERRPAMKKRKYKKRVYKRKEHKGCVLRNERIVRPQKEDDKE